MRSLIFNAFEFNLIVRRDYSLVQSSNIHKPCWRSIPLLTTYLETNTAQRRDDTQMLSSRDKFRNSPCIAAEPFSTIFSRPSTTTKHRHSQLTDWDRVDLSD